MDTYRSNTTSTTTAGRPLSLFLASLDAYIEHGHKADVLYDHQKRIIADAAKFIREGNRRGYIEAPTGTGKTVLFVTLAEAFSYQTPHPPKILVVTPTKDLVRQTLGGSQNDKGFAGFAPDMHVGTFYSDTPSDMRSLDAQVTITTYASMAKLAALPFTFRDATGVRHTKIRNLLEEQFDIIFLDEGHNALGTRSRHIISNLSQSKLIIGFTATPTYNPSRSLDSLLPTLIHRLDLKEAIELNMLSPVIPLAVPAPEPTAQELSISRVGEYEANSLKHLLYSEARNTMITRIAADVVRAGHTPIIACIPGDTMMHPQLIAQMLSQQHVNDERGVPRPIRVWAITSSIPAATRQKIYSELENGTIDALTYIDVLTEGWDSLRANVIINARPTRSLVSARQRTGRILRVKSDNKPALAIDIVDTLASNTAPQVSMADIFSRATIENGSALGQIDPAHAESIRQVVTHIFSKFGTVSKITNTYTAYMDMLNALPTLTRGHALIKQDGKVRTFAASSRLFSRLYVDSFALEYLTSTRRIETRTVRRYQEAIEAYDEDQIQQSIAALPDAVHTGMGLRVGDMTYVSFNELTTIILRKYPYVDASYKQVESVAHEIVKSPRDLHFTRKFRARTHRGVILYTCQTMVTSAVGQEIVATFKDA